MKHTIRSSSSYARSYFDENGVRRQEDIYRVKVKCDCGAVLEAPIHPVDEITKLWELHKNGEVGSCIGINV